MASLLAGARRKKPVPREESGIALGFEAFSKPLPRPNPKPEWQPSTSKYAKHQARTRIDVVIPPDRPQGRAYREPPKRGSPREGGRLHLTHVPSEVAKFSMPRLRKVVDPKTDDLCRNRKAEEGDVVKLYGRVRVFPEKRMQSHGIFPADKNYPPSRDGAGRRIDYSLQQHGGVFASRVIRTEDVAVPPRPDLLSKGVLKNSTVERARHADVLRKLQPPRTATPASSVPRTATTPASSIARRGDMSRASSRSSLASRGSTALRSGVPSTAGSRATTGTSLSSWQAINSSKDAQIAALEAKLASMR